MASPRTPMFWKRFPTVMINITQNSVIRLASTQSFSTASFDALCPSQCLPRTRGGVCWTFGLQLSQDALDTHPCQGSGALVQAASLGDPALLSVGMCRSAFYSVGRETHAGLLWGLFWLQNLVFSKSTSLFWYSFEGGASRALVYESPDRKHKLGFLFSFLWFSH